MVFKLNVIRKLTLLFLSKNGWSRNSALIILNTFEVVVRMACAINLKQVFYV